jgi:hypothetical protein
MEHVPVRQRQAHLPTSRRASRPGLHFYREGEQSVSCRRSLRLWRT